MRWELGARETIEMTRNDSISTWHFVVDPDSLATICYLQVAEIHANLQAWDLSVNVTIHFERITKFDFFDESKKGAVLFFERPALVCCPNACQRNRPHNFVANMGQIQGWRCEHWQIASPFVTHENVSLRQRLTTWRVEAPAVKRGGHERMVTWSELVRKT